MAQSNYSTKGPNALTIIDQSIFILRDNFATLLWRYYLGTLPFLFGVLLFLIDMTKGAFASSYLLESSLGVALLFFWMKFWHINFCRELQKTISQDTDRKKTVSITTLINSIALQSIGLFLIPLSFFTVAGVPFAFAFFQYGLILDENENFRSFLSKCRKNTILWPMQNSMILSVLLLAFIFVMINAFTIISMIPLIAIKILGLQSFEYFGNSGSFWVTFILSTLMISWSIMDPIIKAIYSLRYYYGMSIKNGMDLIVPIRHHKKSLMAAILFITIISPLFHNGVILAENKDTENKKEIVKFEGIVDNVIKQPIYAWRLPAKIKEKKELGKTDSILKKIMKSISKVSKKFFKKVKSIFSKIKEWLDKLAPKNKNKPKRNKSNIDWIGAVNRILLGLLAALLVGAITWAVILYLRDKNNKKTFEKKVQPIKNVDLEDHNTTALDLPSDQWLQLVRECLEKGDFRLAIRAAYLSVLASLGENHLLTLEKHRSNREYLSEISIKGRQFTNLISNFTNITKIFEMVWYGNREAQKPLIDQVLQLNKDITNSVQS